MMNYRIESFPHPDLDQVINKAYKLADKINHHVYLMKRGKPIVEIKKSTSSTGYFDLKYNHKFLGSMRDEDLDKKMKEINNEYERTVKLVERWHKSIIEKLVTGVYYKELASIPYKYDLMHLTFYDKKNPGMIYLIPQAAMILESVLTQ